MSPQTIPADTTWLREFAEVGRRGISGRIFMNKEADSLIAIADEIERLRAELERLEKAAAQDAELKQ